MESDVYVYAKYTKSTSSEPEQVRIPGAEKKATCFSSTKFHLLFLSCSQLVVYSCCDEFQIRRHSIDAYVEPEQPILP